MPRTAIPEVLVYEHDPRKLIPLLVSHLPHSLPVLGPLIASAPPPGASYETAHELPLPYLTFPPEEAEPPIWTCVVPLTSPQRDQIRCYCSLERSLTPLSASTSQWQSCPAHEATKAQRDEAVAQVIGALMAYDKVNPEWSLVGALNCEWESSVRECLGGSKRGFCSLWLPPSGILASDAPARAREGWEVDIGRSIDVSAYQHSSDIVRSGSYYADRLFRSTVIRPTTSTYRQPTTPLNIKGTIFEPSPNERKEAGPKAGEPMPAAAMVLTHLDGAIGALHTSPEYQRLGLARWVVQEHIRNGRGQLYPFSPRSARHRIGNGSGDKGKQEGYAWTCIFHGNVASESLFRGMGWTEEWSVAWVNKGLRDVSEVRRVFKRALGSFQKPPEAEARHGEVTQP